MWDAAVRCAPHPSSLQYVDSVNRQVFHINSVDSHGNTLLIVACQNNMQGIVATLLRKGANVNHQNNLGCTGLHYAMEYGFFGGLRFCMCMWALTGTHCYRARARPHTTCLRVCVCVGGRSRVCIHR